MPPKPFYETPEEMEAKIEEYFKGGYRTRTVIVGNKSEGFKEAQVPAITITDLVLFLGFADRASFYDYEKRPAFSHTIKRARTFIEREYEQLLTQGNPAGAIFALKNFGWKDKTEVDFTDKTAGNLDPAQEQAIKRHIPAILEDLARLDNAKKD